MKLNRNYCLLAFLFIVILFCSLGNNILEGLDTATEVQKADAIGASNDESQYQKMIQGEGFEHPDYKTTFTPNSTFNTASNSNSNLGGDTDKYGCKPSAGEKWCNSLDMCIKPWEQDCPSKKPKTLGGDTDKYGCKPSAGEKWCNSLDMCIQPWETTCPPNKPKPKPKTVGGDTDYYGCKPSAGEKWCDSLQTCIQPWETTCPPNKPKPKQIPGNDYCGNGTIWDKIKKMCITDPNTPSNNSNNYPTDDNFNYHDNYNQTTEIKNKQSNIFGFGSLDSKSDIPSDQQDQYMLKSQMVPPVCPACPPVTTCAGNKKVQPCPPCARCPEPAFDCKKVPNYNSTNTDYLPRPMLNSFSKF